MTNFYFTLQLELFIQSEIIHKKSAYMLQLNKANNDLD